MDAPEQSTSQSPPPNVSDIARDAFLWRRKNLGLTILLVSTVIWVLLDFYQFNLVTVASWVAMLIVTLLFLWGNILRLLGKEPPNMYGLEISEKSAFEVANLMRGLAEEVVRWMFHVTAEREWFVFAQVVAGLLLFSYVGTLTDLLTLLYTGIVIGMTVPVLYGKCGDKIKKCMEMAKVKSRRLYEKIDEKVMKKMKNKSITMTKEEKEKKIE
ncbi:Reticulon-like protein [Melia azedarach]|uniref:Reticulon-like protein n=1 Tax=Melia azedarach TaxID=155640 RepID=A0ACC1XU21_MELAZ|nr:Reticulon-like protein [Melia azedarach]